MTRLPFDVELLRDELTQARWFGAKGRSVSGIALVDEAVVEDGPPALVFALVRVTFDDGRPQLYHMPLLVDDHGPRDAFTDLDRLRIVGDLMAHGYALKGNFGTFYFGGRASIRCLLPGGARSAMWASNRVTHRRS